MTISLRNMTIADLDRVFDWRNSPYIVERSSKKKKVSYEEHCLWFENILHSSQSLPFVIEIEGIPAGHARFDIVESYYVLTIYLIEKFVGQGFGLWTLRKLCLKLWSLHENVDIIAHVREENVVAQKVFQKAGFQLSSELKKIDHVSFILKGGNEELATEWAYADLFKLHGSSHETLNWGSKRSQDLRFKILSNIATLSNKSILDVGCGLGDFANWLKVHDIETDYTGLDITPELLVFAKQRNPDCNFIHGNILDSTLIISKSFDYVFASGIFATYKQGSFSYLQQMLKQMWQLSKKGLAFNSLSIWSEHQDAGEYYADPCQVLSFCRTLSPWVTLRHDYHLGDFTIYVLRDPIQ